jgi:site-specific DNA-methyltransferase (adenine-specific)
MNALHNAIASGEDLSKTEEDWNAYTSENEAAKTTPNAKENYMKYGTIYGKKYSVKTNYGEWDEKFTMNNLEEFIKLYYKKLRDGGTCIIFFDLWKLSHLKELMEKYKFKQIRFIEWIKTNPQPINSRVNYLTNAREIALLGVKKGKPTFNSDYDAGVYNYPIQGGKQRFHPTQKNIRLFEDLIKKHSNEGDLVVDTFLGGGTTAIAAKNTGRRCIASELSSEYYEKVHREFTHDET